MKRKSNENPVSEIIDLWLNQYGLQGRYKEFRLISAWADIMGPMIAKHTRDVRIVQGILYIDLDSAAIRSELSYGKSLLIEKLNREAGELLIRDVVLR
jgi:predicted nucleic acid-binding Zn ribbon protein